jgi:homocysteine S-methyltransferase
MAPGVSPPVVLDGGLSTALELRGADLSGGLWTARLLAEQPELVRDAHRDFFRAGAEVATSATYQASVAGFVTAGIERARAEQLITRGVRLAAEVRDEFADSRPGLLVAASIGPYGAVLADGSEYRGRYGVSAAQLRDFHGPRLELLAGAGPDLLAVETIPDLDEAVVLVELVRELGIPAWFSYSVRGDSTCAGQPLTEAYDVLAGCAPLIAAGANCCAARDVLPAVCAAVAATGLPAVAYPNRGGDWDSSTKTWSAGDRFDAAMVDSWAAAGATYLGGCCGVGPAQIAALAQRVSTP